MRLIDLSVPIAHDPPYEPFPTGVSYLDHARGGQDFQQMFGVRPEDLVWSNGLGAAVEELSLVTHTGTHVDAPWHYHPTSEGKPARTIDELPLEWFYSDGVVLDLRHKQPGDFIEVEDLQGCLAKLEYELKPLDIVMLQTGCDKKLDSTDYFDQPGMGRESTLWLVEQGIKVIGIDAYGFDRKFADMRADYERTGDGRYIWPAHFAGITREYCQIEKLANLDALPQSTGFKVACFPIKIERAGGAFARVVAFVDS
jgi:kynurenine formamidase